MSSATNLSPEQQQAAMTSERAVLAALFQASLAGDFDKVQSVVNDYCAQRAPIKPPEVLLQSRDGNKRTALHFACQSSPNPEHQSTTNDIVQQLLEWLKDDESVHKLIRCKDKDGLTPLMLAAQCPNRDLGQTRVQALLQVSSSAAAKLGLARSKAGATALHYAAGAGASVATVHALYDNANIALSTSSKQGGCPLHWAVAVRTANHADTIGSLLDCGADINQTVPEARVPPPLFMAVAVGNKVHAQFLVDQADQRGLDLTPTLNFSLAPTGRGDISIFHMLADCNWVGLLAQLLENVDKHEVNQRINDEGYSPLDLAAKEGHVGCVLLLLEGDDRTEQDAQAYIDMYQAGGCQPQHVPPSEHVSSSTKGPNGDRTMDEKKESVNAAELERLEEDAHQKATAASATPVSEEDKKKAQKLKAQGNEHFSKGEWDEAIRYYSEAVDADPTDATFYSNRSACFMHLDSPRQALADAIVARQLRPDWPKAAYRMAVARRALGQYEDAAVAAFEGLKLDESNEELQQLLRNCVEKGRQEHQSASEKQKDDDST